MTYDEAADWRRAALGDSWQELGWGTPTPDTLRFILARGPMRAVVILCAAANKGSVAVTDPDNPRRPKDPGLPYDREEFV